VDFEAPDEASRAIREKDHKVFSEKFGERYVRLIQVCGGLGRALMQRGLAQATMAPRPSVPPATSDPTATLA